MKLVDLSSIAFCRCKSIFLSRLEHDVQIRMWDLMAVNNGAHLDRVFVHDFIAAWMIHDLEYKDLWIDRITKVISAAVVASA